MWLILSKRVLIMTISLYEHLSPPAKFISWISVAKMYSALINDESGDLPVRSHPGSRCLLSTKPHFIKPASDLMFFLSSGPLCFRSRRS